MPSVIRFGIASSNAKTIPGASPTHDRAEHEQREGGEDESVEEPDENTGDDASADLLADAVRPPAGDSRRGEKRAEEEARNDDRCDDQPARPVCVLVRLGAAHATSISSFW